jgi:hypothetical protein
MQEDGGGCPGGEEGGCVCVSADELCAEHGDGNWARNRCARRYHSDGDLREEDGVSLKGEADLHPK